MRSDSTRRPKGVFLQALAILLVLDSEAGSCQQVVQQWRLVKEITIGSVDRPNYTFQEARYLLAAPNDQILIVEPPTGEILRYNRQGVFVSRFGRRGRGPGEFESISGLGWRGDSLWVVDGLRSQVSFFSAAGKLVDTRLFPPPATRDRTRPLRPVAVLASGSVLSTADPPPFNADKSKDPIARQVFLRFHSPNSPPDSMFVIEALPSSMYFMTKEGEKSTPLRTTARNHDRVRVAPDGSFIAVVRPETRAGVISAYSVEGIDPQGKRIFLRTFHHTPIPVPADAKGRTLGDFVIDVTRRSKLPRGEALRLGQEILPMPSYRLAVGHLFIGSDSLIWLSRHDMLGTFVVLDARTGKEIAHARMPSNEFTGLANAANSKYMWMVERDGLRIPYVVRYRIEREKGR